MTSITLPSGVTSFGTDVFYDCPTLTIYGYTGSEAEVYAYDNDIPFEVIRSALPPTFTAQPLSCTVDLLSSASLSVTAVTSDTGTLSYAWYCSAAADGAGTPGGGSSAICTVDTSAAGTYYYYVTVTNTRSPQARPQPHP